MYVKLKELFLLLSGAVIFLLFALYNGFPTVSGDTGAYIASGFTWLVRDDRPIFYGLFLHYCSLGISLWIPVFVQSLILSFLLITLLRKILVNIPNQHIVFLITIISLCTICSWYAGQITPDIFTPILCLALMHFFLFKNTRLQNTTFLLIAFFSVLMHTSNFITVTLAGIAILIFLLAAGKMKANSLKLISLWLIIISSWLILCFSNYLGGKGFKPSPATHVFIMGKLVESGVLKTYLDKKCPTANYNICRFKNNLPPVAWEFVWNDNSPLFKTGGWEANRKEYNTIIGDIVSRPKYWPFLALKSMEATARQLTLTNIDESNELAWVRYEEKSSPYDEINTYYPHEIYELVASKQNNKTLNLKFCDELYLAIIILSTLLMLLTKTDRQARNILLFAALFIILNAFATATFANVLTRLNSRIIWLLPAINIMLLYKKCYPSLSKAFQKS